MNINISRPSMWYEPCYDRIRILHPSGLVEMLTDDFRWVASSYTSSDVRYSLQELVYWRLEFMGCL